jgi:phosphoserine aminotransferase
VRAFNFSAGPATLPEAILKRAQAELLDWNGQGASILEVSHRGQAFQTLLQKIIADLRALLTVPDEYHILFLQGGGQGQFAAIPMNLLGGKTHADYVMSGIWAEKAIGEAKKYAEIKIVASNSNLEYQNVPPFDTWQRSSDAAYLHYTANETIQGLEFHDIPSSLPGVPLVADLSSTILSKPLDITQFGLVYASAQKNIAPAGIVLVILHRELLLRSALPWLPSIFNYKLQVEQDSCYNTLPVFPCYMAGLMFEWLKEQGGLAAMALQTQRKAEKLYAAIDKTEFYVNRVTKNARSKTNVVFEIPADKRLESLFWQEAEEKAGLIGLKGHKLLGGLRASLYNAMPEIGVDALIAFMHEFERVYG